MIKASIKRLTEEEAEEIVRGTTMEHYQNHYKRIWEKALDLHGEVWLEFEDIGSRVICRSELEIGDDNTSGYYCHKGWLNIELRGLEGAVKLI